VYNAQLINGATITTTDYKVGSASMRFIAAQSQYVSIAPFISGKKGLSFLFWLKADMINNANNAKVFDFSNGNGINRIFLGFSDNKFFGGTVESQMGFSVATLSNEINDNQWRHFAVIVNPSGYWQVYTNGVLSVTGLVRYPPPVQRTQNYLGKSGDQRDPYFNGLIDDFIMYNYMVSSSVIKGAYARAPTGINS
jgi:hypothetical protein